MKATGIVRRIDDLGRVVIPKEIRRTLRIREGDPLEIFTDREGGVILKKYSPIGELTDFSKEYAESLQQVVGNIILISDKDAFISASGAPKKDYIDRKISNELEDVIMRWAPPCENNTEVYIATVEKRSGISRHTILNRNNREQLIAVVAAMSYVENGVPANMDEVRKGWELI